MFGKSITDDMRSLDPWFGQGAMIYVSMDDKARVPLAKAAATKQSPILMHLDYKVRLPDHDFPVGERHKLIPSVIGVCDLLENG